MSSRRTVRSRRGCQATERDRGPRRRHLTHRCVELLVELGTPPGMPPSGVQHIRTDRSRAGCEQTPGELLRNLI